MQAGLASTERWGWREGRSRADEPWGGWVGKRRLARPAELRTYASTLCPSLSDSVHAFIGEAPSPMRVRKFLHSRVWALRCRRAHAAGGVPVMGRMVCCCLATQRVHDAVVFIGFQARAPSVRAKHKSQASGRDGRAVDGLGGERGRRKTSVHSSCPA
jgi:hypothetical protein